MICQLMSKFSLFFIKKLYFMLIFNSISGNCDPLFLQIHFDHTHFEGFVARGVLSRGLRPGVYVRAFLSGDFMS